jgi:hypothetical protein
MVVYFLFACRFKALKICLKLLYENYNNKYNYPVLVFHNNTYDKDFIDEVCNNINSDIKFINLEFKISENVNESDLFYNKTYLNYVKTRFGKDKINYLHAITWKVNCYNNFEILNNYDWVMILDDDSFFTKSIDFDFFEVLDKNNYEFGTGYSKNGVDQNERDCRQELHNFTMNFCKKYNITPKNQILKKCLENNNDLYLMGKKREEMKLHLYYGIVVIVIFII